MRSAYRALLPSEPSSDFSILLSSFKAESGWLSISDSASIMVDDWLSCEQPAIRMDAIERSSIIWICDICFIYSIDRWRNTLPWRSGSWSLRATLDMPECEFNKKFLNRWHRIKKTFKNFYSCYRFTVKISCGVSRNRPSPKGWSKWKEIFSTLGGFFFAAFVLSLSWICLYSPLLRIVIAWK